FSVVYLHQRNGFNFTEREVKLKRDDIELLTPDQLTDKYEIEGVINRYQFKQVVRLSHLGLDGLTTLMGQIIWGLLLLVPLAAGLLKLFYLRRKKKYVEHFIFTLHTHSFLFLVQIIAALELLIPGTSYIVSLSFPIMVIYFLLALKRVYQQSWGKTLIKGWLLGLGYLFLVPFAIGFTAIIAVLVF
ncbi:MAG: hypothetical protein AAF840_07645, partial [Bacteroidota bacterium]